MTYFTASIWFHCPIGLVNIWRCVSKSCKSKNDWRWLIRKPFDFEGPQKIVKKKICVQQNLLATFGNLGMLRQRLMFPCQVERRQGSNVQVEFVSVSFSPIFYTKVVGQGRGTRQLKECPKRRNFSILIPNFSIISTYFTRIQWVLTLGGPFRGLDGFASFCCCKKPIAIEWHWVFYAQTFQFFITGLLAKNHSYSKLVLVRCQDFVQEKKPSP